MNILLNELNERYYYGECLNNGALCAIEKVKEIISYRTTLTELISDIDIEKVNFQSLNKKIKNSNDIYVKGYILELDFIKSRALELNVA